MRNAIKRIKEKRKALSFTVSQKAYSDILTSIFMFQLEKNPMLIQYAHALNTQSDSFI